MNRAQTEQYNSEQQQQNKKMTRKQYGHDNIFNPKKKKNVKCGKKITTKNKINE